MRSCFLLVMLSSLFLTTASAQVILPFSYWKNLCVPGQVRFAYTGTDQTYAIPTGCTKMQFIAWGGGGGGFFGGGGGNAAHISTISAAGGGGGSSYSVAAGTQTAGTGTTPGNDTHVLRSGAGNGGAGVAINTAGIAGSNGVVILYLFY